MEETPLDIDHPCNDGLTFEDVLEILEQELKDYYEEEDEEDGLKELDFNED